MLLHKLPYAAVAGCTDWQPTAKHVNHLQTGNHMPGNAIVDDMVGEVMIQIK